MDIVNRVYLFSIAEVSNSEIFDDDYTADENKHRPFLVESFVEVKSYRYVNHGDKNPYQLYQAMKGLKFTEKQIKEKYGFDEKILNSDVKSFQGLDLRIRFNGGRLHGPYQIISSSEMDKEELQMYLEYLHENRELKAFLKTSKV